MGTLSSAEGSPVRVDSAAGAEPNSLEMSPWASRAAADAPSPGRTRHRARRRTRPSPGKEPQLSLEFPCNPPRHVRTEGAESKRSVSTAGPAGRMRGGSEEPAARSASGPRGRRSDPRGASPRPARPSPHGACDTQASEAPPPSSARLPFKREAQLDLCRPRRGETPLYGGVRGSGSDSHDGPASRAGGRASGRRPPSPQRSREERGARRGGGGGVGGPGRAGGGEAGEGGEPGRQRSGPPLTAARRGDV